MKKKIVVIGPESTGKSTLCELLASHYKCSWVPEYARKFLLTNGMEYSYEDLLTIARGQLHLEDTITTQTDGDLVVIDTDMHVMKVWCEFVFGKTHPFILEQLKYREYDLYLLCNVDLPWVKDELREYPELETRQSLYNIYHDMLNSENLPWVDISGNYEERLQKAIVAVNQLLNK